MSTASRLRLFGRAIPAQRNIPSLGLPQQAGGVSPPGRQPIGSPPTPCFLLRLPPHLITHTTISSRSAGMHSRDSKASRRISQGGRP